MLKTLSGGPESEPALVSKLSERAGEARRLLSAWSWEQLHADHHVDAYTQSSLVLLL